MRCAHLCPSVFGHRHGGRMKTLLILLAIPKNIIKALITIGILAGGLAVYQNGKVNAAHRAEAWAAFVACSNLEVDKTIWDRALDAKSKIVEADLADLGQDGWLSRSKFRDYQRTRVEEQAWDADLRTNTKAWDCRHAVKAKYGDALKR